MKRLLKQKLLNIFLTCLLLAICCGCKEVIWHALEEPKANQVIVALSDAGIKASKVQDGARWNIAVDKSETYRALRTLDKHRLLQRRLNNETQNNKKLISSREERMRNLEHNLANGLTDTLESLPGVLEAHVHFYFANQLQQEFAKNQPKTSASVVLITKGNPLVTDEHIRNLISGASGIETTNIKVLFALETSQKNNIAPETSEMAGHTVTQQNTRRIELWPIGIGLTLATIVLSSLFLGKRWVTKRSALSSTTSAPILDLQSIDSTNDDQSIIMPLPPQGEMRPIC